MMASSAVYPTPSVGSAASWCWLPKSHLQEERYFKQLYQQKPPRDLGVQRNFGVQQTTSHYQPDNPQKRKYSHSLVTAPHRKQNVNSEISSRNSTPTADITNTSEVLKTALPVKGPMKAVAETSGSLISSLTFYKNFEGFDMPKSQPKATLPASHDSNQSSQKQSDSEVQRSSQKPKLSYGWMTNTLTCFLCQKCVKEIHFREHLFFGALKCSTCHQVVNDCRSFQALMVDHIMGKTSCKHLFEYCSDPFEYLGTMMSDDRHIPGSLFSSIVLIELSLYIGKLRSLQDKDPWKAAIAQCKRHLPSFLADPLENTRLKSHHKRKSKTPKMFKMAEPNHSSPPHDNTPRLSETTSHYSNESQRINELGRNTTQNLNNNLVTGEKRLHNTHDSERVPAICSPPKTYGSSNHSNEEDGMGDLLLSQNYSLEQLEEAVEYVEVVGHCRSENLPTQKKEPAAKSSWKKKRFYKKRKLPKVQIEPVVTEEAIDAEDEFSTEYIETPANGYYYVVRHAIEECPMCYTVLCPSRFTVNVVTFLMTAVCSGCELTIYIVPELPDGTTPGVSIVTEDTAGEAKPQGKQKVKPTRKEKIKEGGKEKMKEGGKEKKKRGRRPKPKNIIKTSNSELIL